MNNKIIYTAIIGGYDDLFEPDFKPDGWDFVCFTDRDFKSDTWDVQKVLPLYKDNTRTARKYKLLPHRWFPNYEYSCWIDGNAKVRNDINDLFSFIEDCNLATYDHATTHLDPRDCIYEEAEVILNVGKMNYQKNPSKGINAFKDDPRVIERQVNKYWGEKMPRNNGLISSMVLFRRHNEKDCIKTMEDWWTEIKHNSKRDQLSFNYVAWKNNFKYNYLEGDVRTNHYFLNMGAHVGKK